MSDRPPYEGLAAEVYDEWHATPLPDEPFYRKFIEEDGRVVVVSESVTNDLVEQSKTVRFRYEVFEEGALVRTELQEFGMRWYFKYEFALLLEKAGFGAIFPHGDYTEEEVRSGHHDMTFRAVR